MEPLADKVRGELKRYEHPLFSFDARPATNGVEVLIRFQPEGVPEANGKVHEYVFLMREREIENAQFPWSFQRQLYDCLHDYVIEMFTRNPQCKDA
ncbi:MAG TPA: hypothetical protein VGZ48_02545 [Candidatus Acidoferrales bacterium]|nr:hypothetical protein [Candidatus Acidoferrales bacterium]